MDISNEVCNTRCPLGKEHHRRPGVPGECSPLLSCWRNMRTWAVLSRGCVKRSTGHQPSARYISLWGCNDASCLLGFSLKCIWRDILYCHRNAWIVRQVKGTGWIQIKGWARKEGWPVTRIPSVIFTSLCDFPEGRRGHSSSHADECKDQNWNLGPRLSLQGSSILSCFLLCKMVGWLCGPCSLGSLLISNLWTQLWTSKCQISYSTVQWIKPGDGWSSTFPFHTHLTK